MIGPRFAVSEPILMYFWHPVRLLLNYSNAVRPIPRACSLERSLQWSILSKAFDKSSRTTRVNFFESIASSNLSVVITFSVSHECIFYCHFDVQLGACCYSYRWPAGSELLVPTL